jgi:mono/diheme cytochrome c family protein
MGVRQMWRIAMAGPLTATLAGIALFACSQRSDQAAPAPVDTTPASPATTSPQPSMSRDTPPGGAAQQPGAKGNTGPQVNQLEYEGWRQYSVQCARCHGQDVLPNPVAANLLTSLAAGGPIDTPEKFTQVVTAGRPHRGMPSFKSTMTPAQIQAVYAYVKGRADKRISPGRPQQPSG